MLLHQRNTFNYFLHNFASPIYSEGHYFKIIFDELKIRFKNIVFGARIFWVLYGSFQNTQFYITMTLIIPTMNDVNIFKKKKLKLMIKDHYNFVNLNTI